MNADGGSVSARCIGHQADAGNRLRQERVDLKYLGAGFFAGIHIRSARKSRGIDQKFWPGFSDVIEQQIELRVVECRPRERNEGMAAPSQFDGEGLAKVAAGAE